MPDNNQFKLLAKGFLSALLLTNPWHTVLLRHDLFYFVTLPPSLFINQRNGEGRISYFIFTGAVMAAFVKVYIDKLKVRFNAQCIRKIEIV